MTSSAVNNVAAIAAALHGADDKVYGVSLQANRRSLTLKHGGGNQGIEVTRIADSAGSTGHPSEGFYGQDGAPTVGKGLSRDESAVADGLLEDGSRSMSRARLRRASEGALLSKHESKRASSELKCEKCGKGYKHSSCLTKHLSVFPPLLSSTLFETSCMLLCLVQRLGRRNHCGSRVSCSGLCRIRSLTLINAGGSTLPNGPTPLNS